MRKVLDKITTIKSPYKSYKKHFHLNIIVKNITDQDNYFRETVKHEWFKTLDTQTLLTYRLRSICFVMSISFLGAESSMSTPERTLPTFAGLSCTRSDCICSKVLHSTTDASLSIIWVMVVFWSLVLATIEASSSNASIAIVELRVFILST